MAGINAFRLLETNATTARNGDIDASGEDRDTRLVCFVLNPVLCSLFGASVTLRGVFLILEVHVSNPDPVTICLHLRSFVIFYSTSK
jgi:hypothetical protein